MEDRRIGRPGLAFALAIALAPFGAVLADDTPAPAPAVSEPFRPPEGLPIGWYANIETTLGDILVRLLPEQAPQSVAHFAGLARGTLPWVDVVTGEKLSGPYYDGMMIHTVRAGLSFETGDAGSLGRSTPVFFVPETEGAGPVNFNQPYVLGMTRMAGGRVSGVRFFVTVASQPALNGESPVFGVVIEGRETVFNISQVKAHSNRRPITDLWIERIRVFSVGDVAPLPEPQPYQPRQREVELRKEREAPPVR